MDGPFETKPIPHALPPHPLFPYPRTRRLLAAEIRGPCCKPSQSYAAEKRTAKHNKHELPVARTGTRSDSKAQTHLIRHVSKRRVVKVIGHVPADLMEALDGRLREVLGL
ncbi:type II toxin-antitoxin system PemK/MazF family toxin [Oceanithermus sp.]